MAAITRLKNGELDVMSGINTATFDELKKSDNNVGFQFKTAQLMKYYNVLINHNNAILKSKGVRKALAEITNVDQYIATFENGNAVRTIGPIHPSKKFYNKTIKPYAFDIEASKKILGEDGWSDTNKNGTVDKKINGKLSELILPLFVSGDLGNNIALMLQADARKAGIGIEITKKEFAQIRKENIETGKYALCLQVSSPDIGYDDLNSKFHSENAQPGDSNQGFYKNTEVDQLITQINTIKDDAQREKLYLQLQQVMNDDLPYIFLYSPKEKFIFSKNWQGSTNVKRPGYQANTFVAQ
jgi:peptide/nickel transport system substrate-binding protein